MDTKNAYYEGYTCSVDVNNLLIFNFKGEVIYAAVNFSGCFHDSKVASLSGLVYAKLGNVGTPPGYAILRDSVFFHKKYQWEGN